MKSINLPEIERFVNMYFKGDIKSKGRQRSLVYKRALFSILALENCKFTNKKGHESYVYLSDVGEYLNRNHATIIHYRDELADVVLKYEEDFVKCYKDFQKYLVLKNEVKGRRLPDKSDIENYDKRLFYQADTEKEKEYMKRRIDHAQKTMPKLC